MINLEDLTLAFRYLYYVRGASPLSDRDYDRLEKLALEAHPGSVELNKPGSDNFNHYTPAVRKLGLSMFIAGNT